MRQVSMWAACVVATTAGAADLQFTEVGESVGIDFEHFREPFIPISSGGAWLDYDDDGWPDLYLTQASGPNQLFRNLGDGTFAEVPDAAGAALATTRSHGTVAADYDNDGDADLFVTANGPNRLLRNQLVETGAAVFVDATAEAGMTDSGAMNSASASWGDYDGDGWLDLYVANHVLEFRAFPDRHLTTPNTLWRGRGDGTFESVGKQLGVDVGSPNVRSGVFTEAGASLATTWSDFDQDGDLDLIVVNDFGQSTHPNQLFRNDGPDGDGGWTFTDVSVEVGFDDRLYGMGIAVGDYDNDGDLDYYASDALANVLRRSALAQGEVRFDEVADEAGVAAFDPELYGPVMGPISWGVEFADFDHDGWLDLLVVNGYVEHALGASAPVQPLVYLYRNRDGAVFDEVGAAAGFSEQHLSGRASAVADFDRDGDLDVFVGAVYRQTDPPALIDPGRALLYRNDTDWAPDAHWLAVELTGTVGNRDAVGARVEVDAGGTTRVREVGTGRSFLSSGELAPIFGLADATTVDALRVRFPSGILVEERGLPVDVRHSLSEPPIAIVATLGDLLLSPGESVDIRVVGTNYTALARTLDLWVDQLDADGAVTTLRLRPGAEFPPGVGFDDTLTARVADATPTGPIAIVVRIGRYPDTVLHQAFEDAVVE